MADLDTIDAQLDELRAVPDDLDELIARYGERDRSLERIDDVLAMLATGSKPRTVPPLGATPSQPPVFVPASVRPLARMSSRPPPRAMSEPAPAAPTAASAPAPKLVDYDALFGPETVPPGLAAMQSSPVPAPEPALALELEPEPRPALELEPEPSVGASPVVFASSAAAEADPSIHDTQPETALPLAAAAAGAELDAVLDGAPAAEAAAAEAPAEEEDGFEMMVEEDDILEIDGDDLEMVDEP
jgi:hypothetical protein